MLLFYLPMIIFEAMFVPSNLARRSSQKVLETDPGLSFRT
jgi:hypothetical protein